MYVSADSLLKKPMVAIWYNAGMVSNDRCCFFDKQLTGYQRFTDRVINPASRLGWSIQT